MKKITQNITWLLGQGFDCNAFIIESKGESLLIDSGLGDRMSHGFDTKGVEILKDIMTRKGIKRVLLTHGHIDHVGGVLSLQSELEFEVTTSKIEAVFLKTGNSSYIDPILGSKCSPIMVSSELEEGDSLIIGDIELQVLHTPGHTRGSISLWDEKNQVLVSGDTVFPQGSFGRTDLTSGSSEEMISSLKRLCELNVKILLPGHMSPLVSSTDSTISSIRKSFENARFMLAYY